MAIPLRILFIEDSENDALLVLREIRRGGYEIQYERVQTGAAMQAALERQEWDLVICDYSLPSFDASDALSLLQASGKDLPFIIVSGSIGEDTAVAALKAGAHDFMLKDNLTRLVPAIQREMKDAEARRERRQAEEALQKAETRYRTLIEQLPMIVYVNPAEDIGKTIYVSPQIETILGYTPEEWLKDPKSWQKTLHPEDRRRVLEEVEKLTSENYFDMEYRMIAHDGHIVWLRDQAIPILDSVGNLLSWQGLMTDITEQKDERLALEKSEANLAAAQRMTHLGSWELDLSNLEDINANPLNWSDEVFRIFGYEPSEIEVTNANFFRAVHPEDRDKVASAVAEALNSGGTYSIDHRIIRPDGTLRVVHEQSVIVFADHGRPIKMVGTVQDITERKQAEEQINRHITELEVLYQSGLTFSHMHDPKAIGEELIRILNERLDWHHAAVRIRKKDSDELELLAFSGGHASHDNQSDSRARAEKLVARVGQGLIGWVIAQGQALRLDDPRSDRRYVETSPSMRSGLYVPLKVGDRTIGGIAIESEQVQAFSADDERLLATLAGQTAVALENAHLLTEIESRANELRALVDVSALLRTAQTVDEMLPRLMDETLTLFNIESGNIWLHDPATGEMYQAVKRGWVEETPLIFKRGHDIPSLVMERGETIVVREFRTDPRVIEENREHFPEGMGGACVPLRAGKLIVGGMFVYVFSPRQLTADELRLLNALAEIGGNAIHRANLYEQTLKQLERLAALRSIDIAISSSFDLNMMLDVVIAEATKQLHVDAAAILLLRPESLILEYAAGQGFWTREVETAALMIGEGLAGKAALERQVMYIDNLPGSNEPIKQRRMLEDEKFVSFYAVPLVAKGKVKGVLEIFHRSHLTRDAEWQQFVEALASQTAIAIDSSALFQDLQRSNLELGMAYDATIEGWSRALDLRDKETEGHTLRVTETTLKLAKAMGIQDEELIHIRRGALLHDIGKMGVPDSILLKPSMLTDEEWVVMRKHPRFAYEMLTPITYLRPALDIPYCHHEKWDGTGYPRGLQGEQIPLVARIFAVVDVWDALSFDRPYRAAWKSEQVLKHIQEQSGKHFDPKVVQVFLERVVNS